MLYAATARQREQGRPAEEKPKRNPTKTHGFTHFKPTAKPWGNQLETQTNRQTDRQTHRPSTRKGASRSGGRAMTRTNEHIRFVGRQIARLRSIEVLNDAQLRELTNEALNRFQTPAALESVIDTVVPEWDRVPKPYELAQLAHRFRAPVGVGCEDCRYTGFRLYSERRETLDGVRAVDMAHECRCRPPIPT